MKKRYYIIACCLFVVVGLLACIKAQPKILTDFYILEEEESWDYGNSSWYAYEAPNNTTANGERWIADNISTAHKTMEFSTILEIENPETGQMLDVRVIDRGPFCGDRVLDLSRGAAKRLGIYKHGSGMLKYRIVGNLSRKEWIIYNKQINDITKTKEERNAIRNKRFGDSIDQ